MANDADKPVERPRSGHYEWMEGRRVCSACSWTGFGREATLGEVFDDGAEYHCPNCDHYFGFVGFPFLHESLSDPRADRSDRLAAGIVLTRVEEFERAKLVGPSQLPDIVPPPTVLTWDDEGEGLACDVVILADGVEIWREPSFFENYRRFGEVAAILQQKYGTGLRDLIPTPRSEPDLWGDKLAAPGIIEGVRAALSRGEVLPRS